MGLLIGFNKGFCNPSAICTPIVGHTKVNNTPVAITLVATLAVTRASTAAATEVHTTMLLIRVAKPVAPVAAQVGVQGGQDNQATTRC